MMAAVEGQGESSDLIVVGGGVSGLALAWKAAQAGRRVTVLEARPEVGGCLHSPVVDADGARYWFELGGHTVYNSYGRLLELIEGAGLADAIVPREIARKTFGLLRDGEVRWLTPPKVLWRLNWWTMLGRVPWNAFRSKEGVSMATHFSRLLGKGNYTRVLAPFLAAVPSQSADEFPATGPGSLFKKRPRRKDRPRSFGVEGGLQRVCEALGRAPGVTVRTAVEVDLIARTSAGFVVASRGEQWEAPRLGLAVPPRVGAELVRSFRPKLAEALGRIAEVEVESVGVTLPKARCGLRECAFVVPVDDLFFSVVTRDPFPDEARRAFTFHFRPGVPRADKLRRMAEVLGVDEGELGEVIERRVTLPSPRVGHGDTVADIDRSVDGEPLAVTGNFFAGLAIEDCIQRSFSEWARLAGEASEGA